MGQGDTAVRRIRSYLLSSLLISIPLLVLWTTGAYSWFWWHPVMMSCAILPFGNAILFKKAGGRENTKYHGYLMIITSICMAFAWYVIHSNKDAFGKPHRTSWHGFLGTAVLLLFFALGLGGQLLLEPDARCRYLASKFVRASHRFLGRGLLVAIICVSTLGFETLAPGKWPIFFFPGACACYLLLTD